jgi:flagellar motor switch protein FliN/FliY
VDEEKDEQQAIEPQGRSEPRPADFPQVQDRSAGVPPRPMTSLGDVKVRLTAQLGTSSMLVKDVLRLQSGSVVELDKLAGEQIDLCINEAFFAKGEVLVIGDTLAIRITEIAGGENLEEDAEQ